MQSPTTHGIDKVNLRIPVGGWRIVVLLRKLKDKIKQQATQHMDKCKNDDVNVSTWRECECTSL